MTLTAIMIDRREPPWIQKLRFGGADVAIAELEYGDLHAATDDGHLLIVERKTPDDLLNSLRDERLFPQMARLSQSRLDQQLAGQQPTIWPYLIITGSLNCSPEGKVITEQRVTAWSYAALQGALLSIQEMGVFVTFCGGDADFENCIVRLGNRLRDHVQYVLPPRPALILGPGVALIASFPGIGAERALEILRWAGHKPAHALMGLTDLHIEAPVSIAIRRKARRILGLAENETLEVFQEDQYVSESDQETITTAHDY